MMRKRFTIIFFLLCFFLANVQHFACAQGDIYCSNCGAMIQGTYWKLDSRILCEECYRNSLPHCTVCGKTIEGHYWRSEGKVYCSDCAPHCDICGNILKGKYWSTKEGIICESCYLTHGPRCAICNKILTDKFYRSPDSEKKACAKCYQQYPPCKSCGIPSGPDAVIVERGFVICPDCARVAIYRHEQMIPIFREARSLIRSLFGIEASIPDENIILTDGATISSRTTKSSEYVPKGGAAGLYTFVNGISTIYVQKGHSPERALEIIAHEYAHLWQEMCCPRHQDIVLREGFAEWVSYKVLLARKLNVPAETKKSNPDSVYGNGLRKMINLEKKLGPSGVVNYVRTHAGF